MGYLRVESSPLQAAKGSTWLLDRGNSQVHAYYLPPIALAWQEAEMARGR
jgi:hypothetical protein